MKTLMKLIMPGGATLAGYAADGIAQAVNRADDTVRAKIARVSAMAEEATAVANALSRMLADGTLDDVEQKALAELLTPMAARFRELVLG